MPRRIGELPHPGAARFLLLQARLLTVALALADLVGARIRHGRGHARNVKASNVAHASQVTDRLKRLARLLRDCDQRHGKNEQQQGRPHDKDSFRRVCEPVQALIGSFTRINKLAFKPWSSPPPPLLS